MEYYQTTEVEDLVHEGWMWDGDEGPAEPLHVWHDKDAGTMRWSQRDYWHEPKTSTVRSDKHFDCAELLRWWS